eukprot:31519-Pelagococcus_subviridis.AAC.7
MMILFASPARSYPCRRFHSSVCSSKTIFDRFRFLMPFSFAKCSHFVIGFSCGGSGFVRGSGVVPAGRCTYRPFTSLSDGSAKRSATSRWRTSRQCASATAVFASASPPAYASGSIGAGSHARRLPRSSSSGPSYASVASSADATRRRAAPASVSVMRDGEGVGGAGWSGAAAAAAAAAHWSWLSSSRRAAPSPSALRLGSERLGAPQSRARFHARGMT